MIEEQKNKTTEVDVKETERSPSIPQISSPTSLGGEETTREGTTIKTPNLQPSNSEEEEVESFDEMHLRENLLRGIYAYGYVKPSIIQSKAILPFCTGVDLIAQAQSGTGKTATFSIGVLQRINLTIKGTQALLLSPTRELSKQTYDVLRYLGQYLGVTVHNCIGGTNVRHDEEILRDGVQIVVGTPGRVLHLMRENVIETELLKMVVIDEADTMLDLGFREQLYDVFQSIPADVQVGLFSATLGKDALDMSAKIMNKPRKILTKNDEVTLDGIQQFSVDVGRPQNKLATLVDLYNRISIGQCIIFCNTRRRAMHLADDMTASDFAVSVITGEMHQSERNELMDEFKSGSTRVLITTDLLCRGIDVHTVSLVLNYDVPRNLENYIHRIGRGGRFGRKGVAISFICDRDWEIVHDIEKFYHTKIVPLPNNIDDLL